MYFTLGHVSVALSFARVKEGKLNLSQPFEKVFDSFFPAKSLKYAAIGWRTLTDGQKTLIFKHQTSCEFTCPRW